jgi:hypothetical protein
VVVAVKRSASLASLSRDHPPALVFAKQLRRATDATAAAAQAAFLTYWSRHGRLHPGSRRRSSSVPTPATATHTIRSFCKRSASTR